MNCHTCIHNRRVPVLASGDPSGGYINSCKHPTKEPELADAISEWTGSQEWDDECMCPEQTDPCPGYES